MYFTSFTSSFTTAVAKYRKMGYDDFEAQIFALKEYEQKGDITFKEV